MFYKFNITKYNSIKISYKISIQFHKYLSDKKSANNKLYHQMIDSFIFLMQYIQFDITYIISILSQFNKNSSIHYIYIIKYFLYYIQVIKNLDIIFDDNHNIFSIDYFNINYVNNSDNRKSIFDNIFLYINNIISFQSQK